MIKKSVVYEQKATGILEMSNNDLSEKYCGKPVDGGLTPEFFCSHEVLSDIRKARGAFVTSEGNILVLERGTGRVKLIIDEDGDLFGEKAVTVSEQAGLNHGLFVDDNFIYASSSSTVFSWPKSLILAAKEGSLTKEMQKSSTIIVKNMNQLPCTTCGAPQGHDSRTLAVDEENRLYVSIGSNENIDENSFRSRIRRFDLDEVPNGGFEFNEGEVFADGLRNEVGISFDDGGVLWGVENGADRLFREDLGGDIHNDNPAEELNRFDDIPNGDNSTRHYGYPFCFSEFNLTEGVGEGKGAQWAWPDFKDKPASFPNHFLDGVTITDEFCKTQIEKPALAMQAHSAPLGLEFAKSLLDTRPEECFGGFPKSLQGDAFVPFHGSWNRDIPTGRKVVRIPFDDAGNPTGEDPLNLFCNDGDNIYFDNGLSPVDAKFDSCGRLLVTSDGGKGKVFMITYWGPDDLPGANVTVNCKEGEVSSKRSDGGIIAGVVVAAIILILGLVKWSKKSGVSTTSENGEKSL